MKISKLSIAMPAALVLGACASSPPPGPIYEPAPAPRYEPAPQPAPMSLHDRVHDALQRQMGSAASGISVRVDGSAVYLGGHVGSQVDHDRAHDIAHGVSGVTSVNHKGLRVH